MMDIKEFENNYNPHNKCYVKFYNPWYNDIDRGLLLDTIQYNVIGVPFIYVDYFTKRVHLHDVLEVVDTGVSWNLK